MQRTAWLALLRIALALAGMFCCYRLAISSAAAGYSRLLCTTAIIASSTEPADLAVRVTPEDPEAHYTRALALINVQQLREAADELQEAIRLRPHHYYQWLDLGVTLDRLNDLQGAAAALHQSIAMAPEFTQPRWQLGNLLYREGKYDDAFVELRLATRSNPAQFENLLDLAWASSVGDVSYMEQLVKPEDQVSHLQTARFLAKNGKGADAARHIMQAGIPEDNDKSTILREVIQKLLDTGQYSAAYTAWSVTHATLAKNSALVPGQILNGDFTNPIAQYDPGFNWQLSQVPTMKASIDPSGPVPAIRSLHLEFNGESDPATLLMYEVVVVQPKSRYSLTFMTKTENLATGGPPRAVVIDDDQERQILGESKSVPPGTNGWQQGQIQFVTTDKTVAVKIGLQRLGCAQNPCPIFGGVWLSKFSLSRIP